jgi:hypothetical protein
MTKLVNFLAFQISWFATVYFAAAGQAYVGVLITVVWMFCHLYTAENKKFVESQLLLTAAIIGYLIDSLQVMTGSMSFPLHAQLGGPSTLWMVALWVNFAATLNYSMKWLNGHLYLAGALGVIAGPIAYYAGSRLGAIEINGNAGLLMIAVQWLIATPLLVYIAGYRPEINQPSFSLSNPENK